MKVQYEDWNYSSKELSEAQQTRDITRLHELFQHPSKFVRAQVAGNLSSNRELRQKMMVDSSKGVVLWLIGNPSLTKEEFDNIFNTSRNLGFCDVVTPALARSRLADISQLNQLMHERSWNIQMAILNNYHGRGNAYIAIIRQYLAHPDSEYRNWSEVEKLAYFRIYQSRLPPSDGDA